MITGIGWEYNILAYPEQICHFERGNRAALDRSFGIICFHLKANCLLKSHPVI